MRVIRRRARTSSCCSPFEATALFSLAPALRAALVDPLQQLSAIWDGPVAALSDPASGNVDGTSVLAAVLLTIAAAQMCGYQGDSHIKLATAVEFMHTATLLHDDVVDESDMRRGKAAARMLWGNEASVLVGDFLYSRSFQMMVNIRSMRVMEILSEVSGLPIRELGKPVAGAGKCGLILGSRGRALVAVLSVDKHGSARYQCGQGDRDQVFPPIHA